MDAHAGGPSPSERAGKPEVRVGPREGGQRHAAGSPPALQDVVGRLPRVPRGYDTLRMCVCRGEENDHLKKEVLRLKIELAESYQQLEERA